MTDQGDIFKPIQRDVAEGVGQPMQGSPQQQSNSGPANASPTYSQPYPYPPPQNVNGSIINPGSPIISPQQNQAMKALVNTPMFKLTPTDIAFQGMKTEFSQLVEMFARDAGYVFIHMWMPSSLALETVLYKMLQAPFSTRIFTFELEYLDIQGNTTFKYECEICGIMEEQYVTSITRPLRAIAGVEKYWKLIP
jgi:hypothetical protein